MLLTDLEHDQLGDIIKAALKEALEKGIPAGMLAHERQKYIRLGMTVDLTFYAPDPITTKYKAIQIFSSLPQCPPLPEIGGTYEYQEDRDKPVKVFTVKNISYKYRYMNYESASSIPEVITDISVYLMNR